MRMPVSDASLRPFTIPVQGKMPAADYEAAGEDPLADVEMSQSTGQGNTFRDRVVRTMSAGGIGGRRGSGTSMDGTKGVGTGAKSVRELAKWALAEITTDEDDEVKMEKLYRVIQIQVNKGFILRELFPYTIFLAMMLAVIFVSRAEDNKAQVHRMVEGITGTLLGTSVPNSESMAYKKTFTDISWEGEWWEWLDSPLAESLWPTRTTSNPHGLFNTYLKPLRFVVIRQLRVKPQVCDNAEAFELLTPSVQLSLPPTCYPDYECTLMSCNLDTAPYGPNGTFVTVDSNDTGLGLQSISAEIHNYESPGKSYAVVLNVDTENYTQVVSRLRELRKDRWVDEATRFLSVEMVTLDRNFDVFVWAAMFCEITAGGLWIPQSRIIPFQFMRFNTPGAVVIFILDIFISTFCVYVLYRLVQGIFRHYELHHEILGYFRFWNTYTISDMVLFGVTYGYRWFLWHLTISPVGHDDSDHDALQMWSKLSSYSYVYETSWNLYAYAAMLALGGLVRFIQYNPRMNMVIETIERALGELLVVILLLALTVFMFGLVGHILFGYYINEFQSFVTSCGTLLRMLPGDFPDDMFFTMRGAQNNTIAASVFLLLYFTTTWLVLLNLVIGVLAEAFTTVKERVGPPEFDFFAAIQTFTSFVSSHCICTQQKREEMQRRREAKQADKAMDEENKQRREDVYGKLKTYKKSGYWRNVMKKKELQQLQLDPEGGDLTWTDEEWDFLHSVLVQNAHEVCDRAVQSPELEMLQKIYATCMQIMAQGQAKRDSVASDASDVEQHILAKLRLSRPSQQVPNPRSPQGGVATGSPTNGQGKTPPQGNSPRNVVQVSSEDGA
eukprot:Hpha_TRINITY_DN11762_c0_g1::TRINITY_DN11762_c0_g1_i1::g.31860::m.31860/K04986/PKD2; polycystin 2